METAYVMINCEMGSEGTVIENLKPIECIKEIMGVFGNYDVLVKIQSTKVDEIKQTITTKIRNIDKIKCTTMICSN